eukprot:TRINITY_DN10927_c0_g1_i1.p1 TRINITY_DN10927_c0_g1~~TRINITY_DN10927_c0_g1_i1.p1  ORF type:complete len:293 (-),score=50.33 TRINITY_DN10927_c0_g1_i1:149-898(-)
MSVHHDELLDGGGGKGPLHNEKRHGWTGNEGSPVDRWYRTAALVFWPVEHRAPVLAHDGSFAFLWEEFQADVVQFLGGKKPSTTATMTTPVGAGSAATTTNAQDGDDILSAVRERIIRTAAGIMQAFSSPYYSSQYRYGTSPKAFTLDKMTDILDVLTLLQEWSLCDQWMNLFFFRHFYNLNGTHLVRLNKAILTLIDRRGWTTMRDILLNATRSVKVEHVFDVTSTLSIWMDNKNENNDPSSSSAAPP